MHIVKEGSWAWHLKVRERMVESGLRLNAFTYMAFVNGFCKTRQLDQARTIFEMSRAGMEQSLIFLEVRFSLAKFLVSGHFNQVKLTSFYFVFAFNLGQVDFATQASHRHVLFQTELHINFLLSAH
jgi:pentatricopeptide repeat protein